VETEYQYPAQSRKSSLCSVVRGTLRVEGILVLEHLGPFASSPCSIARCGVI
jgi:hypothetical protein